MTLGSAQSAPTLRRRQVPPYQPWSNGVHPVVQRVLAARGVDSPEAAELSLRSLLEPKSLFGITAAVDLLRKGLAEQWRIVVVGDFDADGATGTAVAVRGLRMLGADHVDYCVPHRMRHGYGLSAALVAELSDPLPDLILTVDNGIASNAGVAAAKARGIRVLITDHHLPGPCLPAADAIVNPNLPACDFPSKHLAGVGVVFYLLLALRASLREGGRLAHGREPDLSSLLDLVALGTVADLVPLDRNNRILVAGGLKRMRSGHLQAGLQALLQVSGRSAAGIDAGDLGFALAPRLNAAGRLDDMRIGIECLLSDDPQSALALAMRLNGINGERREIQTQMVAAAEAAVMNWQRQRDGPLPAALSLFDSSWHAGVVGLVASRLKEQLNRPVIAFAPVAADGKAVLRGSARSIAGFHIRDALAAVDATHPGLIDRFGGHAMAAGLSLESSRLEAFRQAFADVAAQHLDPLLLQAELWSDGELGAGDFSRELAEQLRLAGPWGQSFPSPLFDGAFEVLDWRVVGTTHLKLNLLPGDHCKGVSAIHFGGWDGTPPPARLRIAYQLDLDDYRDRQGIQLLVRQRFAD